MNTDQEAGSSREGGGATGQPEVAGEVGRAALRHDAARSASGTTISAPPCNVTPPHLGGAYPDGDANTWMPDVWGYLVTKYGLRSMMDLGCGYGYAAEWFGKLGIHAIGLDGDPNAIACNRLPATHRFLHDFTTGPAGPPAFNAHDVFDLAWSAEFLEHVAEEHLPNVMDAFRQCRFACITHAVPGQPGHHHVNCQTDAYWAQRFAEAGFLFDARETELLRGTDRWTAAWGRCTLMFFKRI